MLVKAQKTFTVSNLPKFREGQVYDVKADVVDQLISRGLVTKVKPVTEPKEKTNTKKFNKK